MTVRTIDVRERVMAQNDELAAPVARRASRQAGVSRSTWSRPRARERPLLLERTLAALGRRARHGGRHRRRADPERRRPAGAAYRPPGAGGGDRRRVPPRRAARSSPRSRPSISSRSGCSSSRTSATWSVPRAGTWARRPRSSVFSVTEGEDKPLKYPNMFREAR